MVSMGDVADHAGVSKATVSRVLNRKGPISEEIRAKVLNSCEALHYRMNANVQELVLKSRNGAARNIAFVLVGKDFCDPAYADLIDAISEEVNRRHYQLLLVKMSGREESLYELPPVLRDVRVDGLLVSGALTPQSVKLLGSMETACIVIGNYSEQLLGSLPSVRTNAYHPVREVLNQMAGKGCRRIAFVSEDRENFAAQELLHHFQLVLAELGMDAAEAPVIWGRGAFTGITAELRPLLDQPEVPFDGIFCPDYRLALEVCCLISARYGFDAEQRMTLGTFQRGNAYRLPMPGCSVDARWSARAETALRQLVELLESGKVPQSVSV